MKLQLLHCAVALAFCTATATAADSELKPLMSKPGKVLLSDKLDGAKLGKEWKAAKGKWEGADGAIKGAEVKSDMHGAVARRDLAAKDIIIQYSFKLEGARAISLSINDSKGHNSRVLMSRTGFSVRKDDHDHEGPDKAVSFGQQTVALEEGKWYTALVEVRGKEILAQIAGHTGYGAHEMIDIEKSNFGFTVAGESAQFKDLKVWEALSNSDWESKRGEFELKSKAAVAVAQPKAKRKQK